MATWVTHLMIADAIMDAFPALNRRGFCVGSIAPDCNVENEDWTAFTPSREVTHWMSGERKQISDCNKFYETYLEGKGQQEEQEEKYAFFLGYYAHLLSDVLFQDFIRDKQRVNDIWKRIRVDDELREKSKGCIEDFETIKGLISRKERMEQIHAFEAEYLQLNPNSGYLTEIIPLKTFPDYLDYMPQGCIVRKIDVMGYLPEAKGDGKGIIFITRKEYDLFVKHTVTFVVEMFEKYHLI